MINDESFDFQKFHSILIFRTPQYFGLKVLKHNNFESELNDF